MDGVEKIGELEENALCYFDRKELKEYILEVISKSINHGGFAFGTGNSIPDYVPTEKYLDMVEIVREYRGDFR